MIQNFNIAQLEVFEKDAKFILHFSLDVDEDTVDSNTIFISEISQKEIIPDQDIESNFITKIDKPLIKANLEVSGKDIIVNLPEIKVNTFYEINVTADLKSITNLPLATKFRRRVKIDSIVDSTVEILSPTNFEDVEEILNIQLKEIEGKSKKLFHNYEIQIASEWGFYDILHSMKVSEKSSLNVKILKPSQQYYIRARAISNNNDYGNWSQKITFTFTEKNNINDIVDENDLPEFIQNLKIIATTDQGITPKKFTLIFNKDLDSASIDLNKIILLRKQV